MKTRFLNTIRIVLLLSVVTQAFAYESLTPLPDKPKAPDFLLRDMDEGIHKLSDYKGKPVIINFWASWCPPCRAELPSMNRAWKKVKDEGIEMIALNVGEDEDAVFAFSGEYPIDFTILLDETGEELHNWGIRGLPTTFVIDPQGRIVYKAVGGREWDDDTLLDKVRQLKQTNKTVAKKKVSTDKQVSGKE